MGKFLAVHTVGGGMAPDAAEPVGRAVKANCTADAYWIRSWYTPDDGKFYCEWDAKDAESVRKVFAAAVAQSGYRSRSTGSTRYQVRLTERPTGRPHSGRNHVG